MYKKPSNKQREFMSRITQVRNEGFFKIHKSVLIGLVSDWKIPQLKKAKRGVVQHMLIRQIHTSALDEGLVLKGFYQKLAHGWFKDHWYLTNIKIEYKGTVLLMAKSPEEPFLDVEGELQEYKDIPNKLIKDLKLDTVFNILNKWEKGNA